MKKHLPMTLRRTQIGALQEIRRFFIRRSQSPLNLTTPHLLLNGDDLLGGDMQSMDEKRIRKGR